MGSKQFSHFYGLFFFVIVGIIGVSGDGYTDWLNAVTDQARRIKPFSEPNICVNPAACKAQNNNQPDAICKTFAKPGILAQCQFCYDMCYLTNVGQGATKILITKSYDLKKNPATSSYKLHATLPNGLKIWTP
ncbi:hypothetical protein M8J77_022714 [Diaphorina citri]|nr:hypothetical protein M8J77_022714 [Diaphorina citri]